MKYAKSLDPDETPKNSASNPDTSCLAFGSYFLKNQSILMNKGIFIYLKNVSRRE